MSYGWTTCELCGHLEDATHTLAACEVWRKERRRGRWTARVARRLAEALARLSTIVGGQ